MKFRIERVTEDGYNISLVAEDGTVLSTIYNVDVADVAMVKAELRKSFN